MSQPVIEVTNLSKKYTITKRNRADSLRDLLSSNPFSAKNENEVHDESLWALQDINFELRAGETLGIIGRNGAGKSTLLKILSRVVSPTTGRAVIRGSVASLLEVGTGFHPELSGRENVYFNGALLGMNKAEISRKFQDIVDFSEVEKFIDTPVKRYSSGMRGRLAFSVAAHLDADIMIIDEVLSTGDIGFRKKATEKMKSAAFEGRSVLFVSHTMPSVEDLCDRALYLKNGGQVMMGDTKEVIEAYLGETGKRPFTSWKAKKSNRLADRRIIPKEMYLLVNGKRTKEFGVDRKDKIQVVLHVDIPKPSETMSIGVSLLDEQNRRLFRSAHTDMSKSERPELKKGLNKLQVDIPTDLLKAADYTINLDCDIYKQAWVINPNNTEARVAFSLKDRADGAAVWDPKREGLTKPYLKWQAGN